MCVRRAPECFGVVSVSGASCIVRHEAPNESPAQRPSLLQECSGDGNPVLSLISLLALLLAIGLGAFATVPPRKLGERLFSPFGLFVLSVAVVFFPRFLYLISYFDSGDALLTHGMTSSELVPAAQVVLLSLLAMLSAFWMGAMLFASRVPQEAPESDGRHIDWHAVPLLILGFALLGFIGWMLFISSAGGSYWDVVLNPAERQVSNAGMGYIKAATRLLPFALLLFYWQECHRGRQRWWLIAPATLTVIGLLLVFGQRQEVFSPLLSMVVMRHLAYRPFRPLPLAATALALLSGIMLFVAFRAGTSGTDLDSPFDALRSFPTVASRAFSSPSSSMNQATKAFTSVDSYFLVAGKYDRILGGGTYLNVLLQPVPSALWPGKKGSLEAAGGIVSRLYLPTVKAGTPPTLLGELRMNFGWLGAFVVMLWIGAAFGWAQREYVRRLRDPIVSLWLAAYAPVIFVFVWGASNIWVKQAVFALLPLMLATAVVRHAAVGDAAGEPA